MDRRYCGERKLVNEMRCLAECNTGDVLGFIVLFLFVVVCCVCCLLCCVVVVVGFSCACNGRPIFFAFICSFFYRASNASMINDHNNIFFVKDTSNSSLLDDYCWCEVFLRSHLYRIRLKLPRKPK